METMTLEGLLQKVEKSERITGIIDTLRAAIRERDELRDRLDSALGDRIREFRRATDEIRRAEKAKTELAALKKRIAEAHTIRIGHMPHRTYTDEAGAIWGYIEDAAVPEALFGKRVRLLVEDDDEH